MSPNKDETAVHDCHCQGDMAVRMRKLLAIPRGLVVCASVHIVVLCYLPRQSVGDDSYGIRLRDNFGLPSFNHLRRPSYGFVTHWLLLQVPQENWKKVTVVNLLPQKERRRGDLYWGLRSEPLSITQICACATLLVLNALFGYLETIRIYAPTVSQRNTAQAQ